MFPEVSEDIYTKARAMGLTSHRVDPNDKQVKADSDAWFLPRIAEFRRLMP